jgi:hypothetical protein
MQCLTHKSSLDQFRSHYKLFSFTVAVLNIMFNVFQNNNKTNMNFIIIILTLNNSRSDIPVIYLGRYPETCKQNKTDVASEHISYNCFNLNIFV